MMPPAGATAQVREDEEAGAVKGTGPRGVEDGAAPPPLPAPATGSRSGIPPGTRYGAMSRPDKGKDTSVVALEPHM